MIGYRLLPPAEEEMAEAALYCEAARPGFGGISLDDIQLAVEAETIVVAAISHRRPRPDCWKGRK